MLVHRTVTPSIKFTSTHLYTWVERGTVGVECLAREHNTMSPARARTWTACSDPESCVPIMRPSRLQLEWNKTCHLWFYLLFSNDLFGYQASWWTVFFNQGVISTYCGRDLVYFRPKIIKVFFQQLQTVKTSIRISQNAFENGRLRL